MKIILIREQIELILKALEDYSKKAPNHQLLYATYESLLEQKTSSNTDIASDFECKENVT